MADRVITAEMVLAAKDAGASDVLAKIAGKLDAVAKSAAHSEKIRELGKAFSALDGQMQALDKLNGAQKTLGVFQERAATAAERVKALDAAMAATENPTARMTASVTAAHAALEKASSAVTRQVEAMKKAEGAVAAYGVPLDRTAEAQERLRREMDATTGAIERQMIADRHAAEAAKANVTADRERIAAQHRLHDIAHRNGVGHLVTDAAAAYVSAHSVASGLEKALEAGAERQATIVGMKKAGMGDAEIQRAVDLATRVSRDAPNLDISQILELHKEARSGVTHPEEVFELMPDLARATSVLKGMGAGNANIADIVKAGESLGLMNDPKRFHAYLDAQIRAMSVMGKTVTTEGVYEAAKYSKAAGGTLSDDFLNLTMPSLIQEMHGSSAGDALSSLTKTLRGGLQHKHVPVTKLQELGLLDDPSKIRRSKTGEILGYTGKVKGDDLLATDPDRWFLEYFDKAAEAHGYHKLADKTKLLSETLPGTAANLGRIIIQQRESLTQHRENYRNAPNLEQAVDLQKRDPHVAMQTFTASLNDLEAAVTGPTMETISLGLGHISGIIRDLADAAKAHPDIAVGAGVGAAAVGLGVSGWATARLLGAGVALGTSAHALDAAAAHLMEVGGAPGGGPGGAVKEAEKDAGGLAGTVKGALPMLATAGVIAGAGAFVADAMLNHRDHDKAMIEGGHPDVLPSDNNLGLPGIGEDAPSDPAEAARRAAEMKRQAEDAAGGVWDQLKAFGKAIGWGDRLHADAHGVQDAPLPPERPAALGHPDDDRLSRARPGDLKKDVQDGSKKAPVVDDYGRVITNWSGMDQPRGGTSASDKGTHPDDDRLSRARASDADPWLRELQEKEQQQIWQFGQLSDKSGVVLTSFDGLDKGSGTLAGSFTALGTDVGSASHEFEVLALAARTVSTAFASLLQAAGSGAGGNSIINASWGGGGVGGGRGMSGGGWSDGPVTVAGGFGSAGWAKSGATRPEVAAYIRHAFAAQGIDPEIALRVSNSEGFNKYVGDYGTSFGPFQLHYGGSGIRGMNNGGLGDRFTRETGLNARDPTTWRAQVLYAAKIAKREGWGAWHGWHGPARAGMDYHGAVPAAEEHPALAAPPLKRRVPAERDGPGGHIVSAKLDRVTEKLERVATAVERGGLHRVELILPKGTEAKKRYQRGAMGVTMA